MEPLAPGTEDDPLCTFQTKSKKEAEDERALSQKGYLKNGTYGNIFELDYVQGAQHWHCRVCDCPVLGRLFNHEIGKRHLSNMQLCNRDRRGRGEAPQPPGVDDVAPIYVAPGEPVPPGFEEEIEKVTQIQERLDAFNVGPLIGLEYVLELQDYDASKEPQYLCILCDKKGDPRTVLTHLTSYNHITTFLQKHFPTCYRQLAPYMTKQYKRNWQEALQKIADAIESTFGRLKPIPVEADKFEKNRMHYFALVAKGKHFSEFNGPTFENLVSKEHLTKVHEATAVPAEKRPYDSAVPFWSAKEPEKRKSPSPPVVAVPTKRARAPAPEKKRQKSLSPVSDASSSDLDERKRPRRKSPPRRAAREFYSRRYRSPSPVARRRSPSPRARKPPPRDDERRKAQLKNDRAEKMDEYKKLSRAIDNDMEKTLKQHMQNPEKHPKYNDEWKKFWNMRYKELQAEGKNPSTHDFKPEWIDFWNKKLQELHQDDTKARKAALRKRLGLPDEPAPISFRIQTNRRRLGDTPAAPPGPPPTASQPDNDPEVIVIDDRDPEPPPPKATRREPRHEPRRSLSPISPIRDDDFRRRRSPTPPRRKSPPYRGWETRHYRAYRPPKVLRDVTRAPVMSPPPDESDDEQVNIVAVLRLLTALEERLGSLGPKVNDLLAQALAMEKKQANSSEDLLESDINCVLFETVKEKLKGQLIAGLVDYQQERAFKKAIKQTASLIHAAGERKEEREKAKPKKQPLVVPGIGTVDKAAIAKQIANALIAQGKTDVTQAELEQLINAVVGMADKNKQMTTSSFLQKISSSKELKIQTPEPVSGPSTNSSVNMEGLSDSDLQTLLQNFKDLSTEEQHGLINYLKKLEAKEPERVEKLRKFVNAPVNDEEIKPTEEKRDSPVKSDNSNEENLIAIDSDEDDYSYDDVAKAASQVVQANELKRTQEKTEELDLNAAKAVINSLMTNLNSKASPPSPAKINILQNVSVATSAADIARSLGSITMSVSSLGSILGNVKSLQSTEEKKKFDMFETETEQKPRYDEFNIEPIREHPEQSYRPEQPFYQFNQRPGNREWQPGPNNRFQNGNFSQNDRYQPGNYGGNNYYNNQNSHYKRW